MNVKTLIHIYHFWEVGGGTLAGAFIALHRQGFPFLEGNWGSLHKVVFQGSSISFALNHVLRVVPPLDKLAYLEETYQIHLWSLLGWVVLGAIVGLTVEGLREKLKKR